MAVAEHAGVSAMTVSRVLKRPEKVAEETRERVLSAIDALGYVPNLAANTLRREPSGVVAAMVPTIENSVFSDTVQGISDILENDGYQLLLGCTSYNLEKEEKLTRAFLGRRPDGIILTGTLHTAKTRKLLLNAGIPVVEMWDISDDHIDMGVGFDNFQIGYEIASHVFRCGYVNVGYVGTTKAHEAQENRAAKRSTGIYAAFEDAGLRKPMRYNVEDPLDINGSGVTAADFIAAHPELDAVICANEIIGVGAMSELQRRGWSIPQQIGLAGIGDANIAELVSPGLTTIRIPGRDIGERSAQLMLKRLRALDVAQDQENIGFQLMLRGSTRSEPH